MSATGRCDICQVPGRRYRKRLVLTASWWLDSLLCAKHYDAKHAELKDDALWYIIRQRGRRGGCAAPI